MKTKIKIRKWVIFTKFGRNAVPYILDASKLDVSEEELSLCIQEQVYNLKVALWGKTKVLK